MSAQGTSSNPLVAFAQDLESWFETKASEVVQWADNFLPQAAQDIEIALEDLVEIAGAAVLAQAPAVISGTEKFGNAVASVIQTVEAQGRTVATQTAQMAVQQAYLTAQQQVGANG